MKRILLYATITMLTVSCTQNEPLAYEDNPAIFLPQDEISHSFFYSAEEVEFATVKVKVHAMGRTADIDRPFILEQSNKDSLNAAIEGTHYLPFNTDEMKKRMVIPAGENEVEVPITLFKNASLDLMTVTLSIRCVENEYFIIGATELQETDIHFSSQAIKPNNWDDWYYAFGETWGSMKMRFIIDHTGITNFDTVPNDGDYMQYLNSKLKQKLFEYNTAHPDEPLAEADNTLVNFDNPYRP